MTTEEFLALALSGPHSENLSLELRRFVRLLYDHLLDITLADGAKIYDGLDLREFCREAMMQLETMQRPRPIDQTHPCDSCHHDHTMKAYCGAYLGEGKFCQCEARVMA